MSRALDREVTYVPIELDEFAAILRGRGAPYHLIQHLLVVAVDCRNGVFADTNDIVKTVGGSHPLDVEGFVAQNRAAFDLPTTI